MATTRLKKHHTGKGQSAIASIKGSFDYGQNPEKTNGGELILAYKCDYETASAEFALSKAQYLSITGREQKKKEDVSYPKYAVLPSASFVSLIFPFLS